MQHTQAINQQGGLGASQDAAPGSLLRAIRYLGRYRQVTLVAYSTLFVAAAAQLAVPQLLQNSIDPAAAGCHNLSGGCPARKGDSLSGQLAL